MVVDIKVIIMSLKRDDIIKEALAGIVPPPIHRKSRTKTKSVKSGVPEVSKPPPSKESTVPPVTMITETVSTPAVIKSIISETPVSTLPAKPMESPVTPAMVQPAVPLVPSDASMMPGPKWTSPPGIQPSIQQAQSTEEVRSLTSQVQQLLSLVQSGMVSQNHFSPPVQPKVLLENQNKNQCINDVRGLAMPGCADASFTRNVLQRASSVGSRSEGDDSDVEEDGSEGDDEEFAAICHDLAEVKGTVVAIDKKLDLVAKFLVDFRTACGR
jgi:hypothetical protein